MHDATSPEPNHDRSVNPTASAEADLTGQIEGDYHILRRLGVGGMGEVYLAEQLSLKRKVALKFLRPDLAANASALGRFRREAEAVARLNHPNIVQVYAVGELHGRHFMALEYVEGRNLRDYLARKGQPDLPIVLLIMRQVAAALQSAADAGIVHRDIKPENILLTRKGEVKVADFGLSRTLNPDQDLSLTQPGVAMGTPLYMSPEQAMARPLDIRSDIYSFGVTCYHMLAGSPPFQAENVIEIGMKHVHEVPKALSEIRPDLPAALLMLVHRMLCKDPKDRPQTAREVLRELSQPQDSFVTEGNPFAELTMPPSAPPRTLVQTPAQGETTEIERQPRGVNGRRWLIAGSLVAAVVLGIGLRAWITAGRDQGKRSEPVIPPVMTEEERQLREAVKLYAAPKAPDKTREGAGWHVELGILLLDEKRFADAEAFFRDMVQRPDAPPSYRTIGQLGTAIALSMRDEVEQSNRQFLALKPGTGYRSLLPMIALPAKENVSLRHWVGMALERNALRGPLPKELEDIRKEVRIKPRPPAPKDKDKSLERPS